MTQPEERVAGIIKHFPIITVTRARDGAKQIKGDNPCKPVGTHERKIA